MTLKISGLKAETQKKSLLEIQDKTSKIVGNLRDGEMKINQSSRREKVKKSLILMKHYIQCRIGDCSQIVSRS